MEDDISAGSLTKHHSSSLRGPPPPPQRHTAPVKPTQSPSPTGYADPLALGATRSKISDGGYRVSSLRIKLIARRVVLYVKLQLLCPIGSDWYIDKVTSNYNSIFDDVTLHNVITSEVRMLDAHVMAA